MVNDAFVPVYSLNEDQYSLLLDREVEMATERPNRVVEELADLFYEIPTESTGFAFTDVGSVLGTMPENEDEDDIPAAAPARGRKVSVTLTRYRMKLEITDRLKTADRLGKTMSMARGLPNARRVTHEYARAAILDDAFNGSTFTGSDSVSLCNDSHVPEHPLGSSIDNKISGSLNVDNWHAMRQLADNMTDERGYPCPLNIKHLVVGPSNRRIAEQLRVAASMTKLDPETTVNRPMVLAEWDYRVSHYMSDTNSPWFGFTDVMGEERGVYFFYLNGKKEQIDDVKPSDNAQIIWAKSILTDFTVGLGRGWEYVFGSSGTA